MHNIEQKLTSYINVANSALGSKIISCSDDFFAPAHRMLKPDEPIFIADKHDANGKWMDGWETRRRRYGGNDFCVIKLSNKSIIKGVDIDTSFFNGNHPPSAAVFGGNSKQNNANNVNWFKLLSSKNLQGNSHNFFNIINYKKTTHLKIIIYPDGGIARLRAYGNICFDNNLYKKNNINVASISTGAKAIYANNEHFGKLINIINDNKPINMADGWETRRRRKPGNDWGIIKLAKPATINKIIIDTSFFKGNYPDSFSICATLIKKPIANIIANSALWQQLISQHKLGANCVQTFDNIIYNKAINHIRINIFPDGGIARLKLIGNFIK